MLNRVLVTTCTPHSFSVRKYFLILPGTHTVSFPSQVRDSFENKCWLPRWFVNSPWRSPRVQNGIALKGFTKYSTLWTSQRQCWFQQEYINKRLRSTFQYSVAGFVVRKCAPKSWFHEYRRNKDFQNNSLILEWSARRDVLPSSCLIMYDMDTEKLQQDIRH